MYVERFLMHALVDSKLYLRILSLVFINSFFMIHFASKFFKNSLKIRENFALKVQNVGFRVFFKNLVRLELLTNLEEKVPKQL